MKRSEALKLNLSLYNTGKPCKNGHLADRYTSNGGCVECTKIFGQEHKESHKEIALAYYHKNAEKINEKIRQKYKDNSTKSQSNDK